jgi:hypothetical protein
MVAAEEVEGLGEEGAEEEVEEEVEVGDLHRQEKTRVN